MKVRWYMKPLFFLYSYTLAVLLYSLCALLHLVCRIRFEGRGYLLGRSNFIFCLWHDNVLPYFVTFLRHGSPHIWMNHPAWYMKPIHLVIRMTGVKGLVLGSTGHSGQEAAVQLVNFLKEGYSTVVFADGPAGPPKVLKKGVLHMARESRVPIVPMRIMTPHSLVLKSTWEGKRIPLPFSTVRVVYERPISVTEENFDEASRRLTAALGRDSDEGDRSHYGLSF